MESFIAIAVLLAGFAIGVGSACLLRTIRGGGAAIAERQLREKLAEQETTLKELHESEQASKIELAHAQGMGGQLQARLDECEEVGKTLLAESRVLQEEKTALDITLAKLNAHMIEERKGMQEKLRLLEQAECKMSSAFENLANRILEESSKKFTEQNQSNIAKTLNPLREQLGDFRKRIDDVYDKESKDRRTLYDEVANLKNLNERISQEALNLTRALKGEAKQRGNWGEIILERVLENSGLAKGREYKVQQSFRDSAGSSFRPDAIVYLPEGRHLVIDSKVSLIAYEEYFNAEDKHEREACLKQHIVAVNRHVSELADKGYSHLETLHAPNMVFMFVPIEPALQVILERDWRSFESAFNQGIVLVSPSTLMMNLQLVHNLWRHECQNLNAQEIARQAGNMHDKFALFVKELDIIGNRLDQAKNSWTIAKSRLSEGRGNLLNQAVRLREMGADAKKHLKGQDGELPTPVQDAAGTEAPE
ncbi:MAG: DNA recombination protein RmuC [Candidatus Eutrophobiaceae bacterium]